MTPQRIAAIKALADDPRGEPNTRAIAKAKLEQYRIEQPPVSQRHPSLTRAPEHDKFRFMDMGQWKRTRNGNYTISVGNTRITLWKRKTTNKWTWVKDDLFSTGHAVFTPNGFDTIGEAQRDAWTSQISRS